MSKEPISVKRLDEENNHVFMIKQGDTSIKIDVDKAEFLCRTLSLYIGLDIKNRDENIAILTQKANQNSTIANPLGT